MSKKPEKSVPDLRFKGFTNDWEQKKLGDVVKITMGQSPKSDNYTDNPEDYILVQGNADIKNNKVYPRVWTKQITKTANKGDIILTVRAPVGEVGKTDYDVVLGRGVSGIKGNNFIYYSLKKLNSNGYWTKYSTGSTFESINSNDINNAIILISSEKEQKRIGEFFEKVDFLITLHQRKLELLKQNKKFFLQNIFPKNGEKIPEIRFPEFNNDWEQKKLREVSDRFDNLRIPVTASNRKSGNIPYYGANGIQDFVNGYTHDGEFLLIAEDGASDLRNYPVNYVNGKVWVNNHAHVIKGKKNIVNNKFLQYSLKIINYETYVVGGSRAKLNSDILMNLPIKSPNTLEQEKIGTLFQKIDSLITFHQNKLEKLQNLKKFLLNKLFI